MPAQSIQPSSHPYNPLADQVRDDDRIAERRAQVAKLVISGMRQRSMASMLGVSVATINDDMKHIRAAWRESMFQATDDAKAIDIERTDEIIKNLWTDAVIKGDNSKLDRLIRVLELRSKILGYALGDPEKDKPQSQQITIVEVVRTVQSDGFAHLGGGPTIDIRRIGADDDGDSR